MENKDMVKVRYYAHKAPPFEPDAEGYVDYHQFIDHERNPWYTKWVGDELVGRKGYTFVRDENEVWHIVKNDAVYTEVVQNDGLEGGYGRKYPGGGLSATDHFDFAFVGEFDETILVQRFCW